MNSTQIVLTLLAPTLAVIAVRRVKVLGFLGPVVLAYAFGIAMPLLLAALPIATYSANTADTILSVALPLSLPLLLFSMDVRGWLKDSRPAALSFLFACVAAALSVTIVFVITTQFFSPTISSSLYVSDDHNPAVMAGMMAAMYTGGTPNMAVVHKSLSGNADVFLQLNAADVLLGGLWFLWLITLAKPLLSQLLPASPNATSYPEPGELTAESPAPLNINNWPKLAGLLLLSAGGLTTAVGLSQLLFATIHGPFVMLSVTALGIAVSLSRWQVFSPKSTAGSYDIGLYLVLVFCCALGSLVNPAQLLSGALPTVAYVASIMLLTLVIHLSLAKWADIDVDTFIITHTAALFGPPFVPPVANALKNRAILLSGLTTGLVGYAVGSYLGLAVAWLLSQFPG